MQTKKILDTEKTMTARQAFRGKSFDDEENDVDNKLVDIIKKYFVETSIHGLKYIFEVGRFFVERLYWIIACITLWSIGFYLIYQVSQNSARFVLKESIDKICKYLIQPIIWLIWFACFVMMKN